MSRVIAAIDALGDLGIRRQHGSAVADALDASVEVLHVIESGDEVAHR